MTPTSSATRGENWLQGYLLDAVRKNLCIRIFCTTCGAEDFRRGLLVVLAGAMGRDFVPRIDNEAALAITRALALVHPGADEHSQYEDAVRLILFEIWQVAAEHEFELVLEGTWAGGVLARMKAHHKAREDERRAFAESQDPIKVQQRREEKRRIRQEKHSERLNLKRERDRLWREKQEKGGA